MITTAIILVIFSAIALTSLKFKKPDDFLTLDTANVIRGICAITVVLVHIPSKYSNPIQNAVGSLAQVAVTMFFLLSAYGLTISIKTKKNYLQHFFTNRICTLFIPLAISMAIKYIIGCDVRRGGVMFVLVLTLFYFVFYIVQKAEKIKHKNAIIILFVLTYSIFGYFFGEQTIGIIGLSWYTEALGFAAGILIGCYKDKFFLFCKTKTWQKIILFTITSGILGAAYLKFKQIPILGNYILKALMCASLCVLILMIFSNITLNNKISVFIGTISLEIFLYHGAAQQITENILPNLNSNLYILMVAILTGVFAYVMKFADKKLTNLIKK